MIKREILYHYFSGTSSTEEELILKKWIEESPANKQAFLREWKFSNMIMMAEKPIHHHSLKTGAS